MKRSQFILVGLGAAALLLAGCASSGATASTSAKPSTSSTARTSAGATGGTAFAAFQACLKQHGVTSTQGLFGFRRDQQGSTPNATPSTRPTLDAKTQAAFTACRALLPQGGFGARRLTNTPQFAAFQTCMKDHGVTITLPANDTATTGAAQPAPTGTRRGQFGLDLTNAKTKAAYETCKVLLPNAGGFGRPDTATALSPNPAPSA